MNFNLSNRFLKILKTMIWLVFSIYVVFAFKGLNSFDLKIAVLLCGILIQLTVIKFLKNWYLYKQPFLLDWFRLATFLFVIVNFMTIVYDLDGAIYLLVNNAVNVSTKEALPALIVVLVGLLALRFSELFVLYLFKNHYSPINRSQKIVSFRQINIFYLSTFLIGLIQFYLLLNGIVGFGAEEKHSISNFSFLLQFTNILGPIFLVIYSIIRFQQRYKNRLFDIIFLLYFMLQIVLGFISGMKESIIIPIIIVSIPYLLGGNKVPKSLVVSCVVFVILLYPINNNYRRILNESSKSDKVKIFGEAISETIENGFVENMISGSESYQGRISLFPVLMYSLENEQHWINYKYLNRYVYLPFSWIVPRAVLPNKPVVNGTDLYFLTTGRTNSSITPSTYGWAYFEGGLVPVFLSFFLFGAMISFIQIKLSKGSFFHLLIYTMILVSLLKVESDIYFKLSSILQTFLVGLIVYNVFFKSKTRNHG